MLTIEGEWFVDEKGRKVLLRGVNLGGSSKVPLMPNGATHIKSDFTDLDVSFVGRPFPIDQARQHFERIKHWGFNALRFIVTWEAIEHAGPKQYDAEYLDYLEDVLKIAAEHRLYTFIDPHQDVWSRASGGDGAPIWTFEKAGLDITKFDESEAAFTMQSRYNPDDPSVYLPMAWAQNFGRFASCHMFTLFFGGNEFAPTVRVDGMNIQDYLQEHYMKAIQRVAYRVKDNPYVVGFETLNEPNPGWIGRLVDGSDSDISIQLYYAFTPFDAMVTAAGFPRVIPFNAVKRFALREIRRDLLNSAGVSCWLEGSEDIWRKQGIWNVDESGEPMILNNEYFMKKGERPIDFVDDYFAPFVQKYAKIIREVYPDSFIGVVPPPEIVMRGKKFPSNTPPNIVNAAHWYDEMTIGTKRFRGWISYDTRRNKLVVGTGNILKMFTRQLSKLKDLSQQVNGGIPTVLGEFGLCFDLNNKEGMRIWNTKPEKAWQKHIKALSLYYDAVDVNFLHSMIWNYTADNDNVWGDQWNQEDFSIFSITQQRDPENIHHGGRAIEGFCRPHFVAVAGTPLTMSFSRKTREFHFTFDADTSVNGPTIVYVPEIHYPHGYEIILEKHEVIQTGSSQLFAFRVMQDGKHSLLIRPKKN
ncbi:MAG: cellulase family glycosylhydrolase [Candidatus Odinarchaeota archaeon]